MKLYKEIKLKSGIVLEEYTDVEVRFLKDKPSLCIINKHGEEESYAKEERMSSRSF